MKLGLLTLSITKTLGGQGLLGMNELIYAANLSKTQNQKKNCQTFYSFFKSIEIFYFVR